MLIAFAKQRGASLMELMIAAVIVIVLLGIAAPNFATWIQNGQIRTSAESFQNGLQLAKSEAVSRNSSVGFYITSTGDNSCALSTSGTNWVVSTTDPTSACGTAASVIQVRRGSEGSKNAVVAVDQTSVTFNSLGQATLPSGTVNNINISNSVGGSCATTGGGGGPMRCLRIVVNTSGLIRMCDPAASSTDSRAC